jgi:hypothetical protein
MIVRTSAKSRGDAPSTPQFGPTRPTFGLARDQGRRVEVSFAMRNGGTLTVLEEMEDPLTDEMLQSYSEQLAKEIASGEARTFTDGWSATGQRAWVLLREVVAFSVRPAK